VIIVGAGIAGSTMAIMLGERGWSILLLDKARFPRHKACGEGLMPGGVAILERLGILEVVFARGARTFREMRFRSAEGVWAGAEFPSVPSHPDYGLVLPRRELDHVAFESARAHPNVEARDGFRVVSLCMQGEVVEGVTGVPVGDGEGEQSFTAGLTVGADGPHSIFHRACSLNRSLLRRRRFGVTGHYEGVSGLGDRVEVLVQPEGEIYVARGPADLTLVALLLEERAMREFRHDLAGAYEAFVRGAPGLRKRVALAELAPPISAVGPLGFAVDRCYGPGFLLIGDAAGFLDPISGMGMTIALQSVCAAVPILERALATGDVSAGALAPYERLRSEAVRDAVRFTRILLQMARHKAIANRAVRRLRRNRELLSRLLGLASGATRYRDIRTREKLALLLG
jgi:2-polyprenyl-6-methoxyphenol hydroxylase-like FAD-dependent oxidoreductase